jgi:hypothetical protein
MLSLMHLILNKCQDKLVSDVTEEALVEYNSIKAEIMKEFY